MESKRRIKIGYFADGPWSHLAFERIIEDKEIEIAFIVPRNDTTDRTLYNYGKQYSIDYIEDVKVNSEEFYKKAKEYECDMFVSMSYNQIFRSNIINLPPLGIINCHAGKLPFYRGRNILNWVLINDENEFGITAHFVDEGIDTGDIILQEVFPITDSDTYKTLLNKAYVECARIIHQAILRVKHSNFKRIKQKDIHPVGIYCGQRKEGDELLDWSQTSREVFNFVRAICKPGPAARSTIQKSGNICIINKVEEIKNAPTYKGIPGQVLGKIDGKLIVKTKDTFVKLVEFELVNGDLRIGDRLKR